MHAAKVSGLLVGELIFRVSRWCLRRAVPCLAASVVCIVRIIGGINGLVNSRRGTVGAIGAVSSIDGKAILRWHGSPGVLVLHVLLTLSNRMLYHVIRHAFSEASFLTFTGIDLPNQTPWVHLWLRPAGCASEVKER